MSNDHDKTNDTRQAADRSHPLSGEYWNELLEPLDYETEIDHLEKSFQLRQLLKHKEQENSAPDDSSRWINYILPQYLLPTHFVSEEHFDPDVRKISTRFEKTINGYIAEQSWDMRYFEPEEFAPATYRAELLLIKRKIYEQGDDLWDLLTLDSISNADFHFYPAKFGSRIEVLKNLMKSTDSHSLAEIEIRESADADKTAGGNNEIDDTDNIVSINGINSVKIFGDLGDDEQGNVRNGEDSEDQDDGITAFYYRSGFRRYADAYRTTSEQTVRQHTILHIRLDSYWLAWSQAAHSIEFDFAYLAQLETAAEMRFYELIKLLLYYRRDTSESHQSIQIGEQNRTRRETDLKIDYKDFARLMPLPVLNNEAAIRRQLKDICAIHIEQNFIKEFIVEKTTYKDGTEEKNKNGNEKGFLIKFKV